MTPHLGRVGHFKQLKAWQHARSVAVLSKAAISRLPAAEANALAAQKCTVKLGPGIEAFARELQKT